MLIAIVALASIVLASLCIQNFSLHRRVSARSTIESANASSLLDSPYYVTCEATILGPTINLVAIQTVTQGMLFDDFVAWDLAPESLARIYVDNTMQILVHGDLDTVSHWVENDQLKDTLIAQFNGLVNEGGIDISSALSDVGYKTRSLSGYAKVWTWITPTSQDSDYSFSVSSTHFKSIRLGGTGWFNGEQLYINGELFIGLGAHYDSYGSGLRSDLPNSGTILIRVHHIYYSYHSSTVFLTLFTGDDASYTSYTPSEEYLYSESPGTGFALKEIVPETSHPNQDVNVTLSVDPPTSESINLTDIFPSGFTLVGKVTLRKFSGNIVANTATIDVTLQTQGSTTQFKIACVDAPTILSSLANNEWLVMEYQLRTPPTPATYSLGIARIEYSALFKT